MGLARIWIFQRGGVCRWRGLPVYLLQLLEGTARYACLLLAPAEGFGLRLRLFLGKKIYFHAVLLILRHFCCSVVTSVAFSSNLSNFKNYPKNPNKS